MTIERIEMALLKLPYVHFFETSFSRDYDRMFIIARVYEDGVCGYGEVVAEEAPLYSGETTEGAWHVLKTFLIPMVFAGRITEPGDYAAKAKRFRGNLMAKGGLELALWDLKAKKAGVSLAKLYGGVRDEIEAGVSCGIENSIPELVDRVGAFIGEGYRRIKLKIKHGWDVEACAAVREKYPDILLQVDANGAYSLADKEQLKKLDAFNLLLVEQPFPLRPLGPPQAPEGDEDGALPRREHPVARNDAGGRRDGELPHRQHQSRPGRGSVRDAEDPRLL